MNNLYYMEYSFSVDKEHWTNVVYGELYVVDTGYGILELGCIENKQIYEDIYLLKVKTIKEYINNFGGEILSFTKVA